MCNLTTLFSTSLSAKIDLKFIFEHPLTCLIQFNLFWEPRICITQPKVWWHFGRTYSLPLMDTLLDFLLFHPLVPFWATLNNPRWPLTFWRLEGCRYFLPQPYWSKLPPIELLPSDLKNNFIFTGCQSLISSSGPPFAEQGGKGKVVSNDNDIMSLEICQDKQYYFLLFKSVVPTCLFPADFICTHTS